MYRSPRDPGRWTSGEPVPGLVHPQGRRTSTMSDSTCSSVLWCRVPSHRTRRRCSVVTSSSPGYPRYTTCRRARATTGGWSCRTGSFWSSRTRRATSATGDGSGDGSSRCGRVLGGLGVGTCLKRCTSTSGGTSSVSTLICPFGTPTLVVGRWQGRVPRSRPCPGQPPLGGSGPEPLLEPNRDRRA